MSNNGITVVCTNCDLVSRRPSNFVRVRRFFICRRCEEMIQLDDCTIVYDPNATMQEDSRQQEIDSVTRVLKPQ